MCVCVCVSHLYESVFVFVFVCVSLEKKTMTPAFLSISFLCRTINQHVSASLSLSLSSVFWLSFGFSLCRVEDTHTHI